MEIPRQRPSFPHPQGAAETHQHSHTRKEASVNGFNNRYQEVGDDAVR